MSGRRYVANVSGGIDSPVAAHMMLARGAEVTLLHFDNRPYADDRELYKARALVARLRELHGEVPALLVPHGEVVQSALMEARPRRLHCVLCKRMMLRVAAAHAARIGAEGVVTGDSLGQVASQTLSNLVVEQAVLGDLPAVRPLIGLDKAEVIAIARSIGTFEPSTAPSVTCTANPNRPSVSTRWVDVERAEEALDVEGMVSSVLDGAVEW